MQHSPKGDACQAGWKISRFERIPNGGLADLVDTSGRRYLRTETPPWEEQPIDSDAGARTGRSMYLVGGIYTSAPLRVLLPPPPPLTCNGRFMLQNARFYISLNNLHAIYWRPSQPDTARV